MASDLCPWETLGTPLGGNTAQGDFAVLAWQLGADQQGNFMSTAGNVFTAENDGASSLGAIT